MHLEPVLVAFLTVLITWTRKLKEGKLYFG